jgi:hypothetical protein
MLTNIDYMIDYGELMNNPKAAKIFDDMEKFVQDSKLKGMLGEIYLLLTFGFQITTRRIFYLFVPHLHI